MTFDSVFQVKSLSIDRQRKLQHCARVHVMHERSCIKLQQDNAQGAMLHSSEEAAGSFKQDTVEGFKGFREDATKD